MNADERRRLQMAAKNLRAQADILDEMAGTLDPAKAIFEMGRKLLDGRMPEARIGGFIGRLRKAVGDDKAIDALRSAPYKADPVSFLGAVMAGRMGWQEYAQTHDIPARAGESWDAWKARVEREMSKGAAA